MEKIEYWRWKESKWINPDIDGWEGHLITAGVDIGSTSTQAVILIDGEPYAYSNIRTGSNSPESASKAIKWAMEGTGLVIDDIDYCIGTGYGRVNVEFADRNITEITCHSKGANYIYGKEVRTILDMGGQDCKVISCDENGKVLSFLMNDKCAAGTGRGMEVIADLLAVHVEDIGPMSLDIDEEPEAVSSTCVIFAKSEATKLMRNGWSKEKVLAAYCHAMAIRVVKLIEKNGLELDFAITGGIRKNIGVTQRIEKILGIKSREPKMDSQIAGALGAALIAKEYAEKRENSLVGKKVLKVAYQT